MNWSSPPSRQMLTRVRQRQSLQVLTDPSQTPSKLVPELQLSPLTSPPLLLSSVLLVELSGV